MGGSGHARLQSVLPSPQMWKNAHCDMSRAPVMPDVSADKKYVWRRGVVDLTPDRTTKNKRTIEPARNTSESGAEKASILNRRGLLARRPASMSCVG